MSTKVERTILVNVPVSIVYDQWIQFEEFPRFMEGVKSVRHLSEDRLEWVAEIAGVRRQWQARILEQVPDRKIAWAAIEGATNAGTVEFEDAGPDQTSVYLVLEYEPEGLVEKVGDKFHMVDARARKDLKRFKEFIEDKGYATGAWRGAVNEGTTIGTPGVEEAAASRGDDGKAGPSGKVIAAGTGVAAAVAAAGFAAAAKGKDADKESATIEASTSGQTGQPTDVAQPAEGETGAATDAGTPVDAPLVPEGTTGAVAGTTPGEISAGYDMPPTTEQPVPPAGSIEDLIPSAGAPRIGADSDSSEQRLGADVPLDEGPAPLDEEPATPRREVPPMFAPDVAPVDIAPPGTAPAEDGRPEDGGRPTVGTA